MDGQCFFCGHRLGSTDRADLGRRNRRLEQRGRALIADERISRRPHSSGIHSLVRVSMGSRHECCPGLVSGLPGSIELANPAPGRPMLYCVMPLVTHVCDRAKLELELTSPRAEITRARDLDWRAGTLHTLPVSQVG